MRNAYMDFDPSHKQNPKSSLNLKALRERFAKGNRKETWRSLDELAESDEFFELIKDEFPDHVREISGINRRGFLKLMAGSLGLAGLTACLPQPTERIMPYVQAPEELVPGERMFYASAYEMDGYAKGVVVSSIMGRPIKIEGNPNHPASLGSTDPFMQASILDLYDPDRAQVVTSRGRIRNRQAFHAELAQALSVQRATGGAGLRLLTCTVGSPFMASQIREILDEFPSARWSQYDPINRDNIYAGAELAFGSAVETRFQFDQAQVIVSLDADFVLKEPGNLHYLREFSAQRQAFDREGQVNRLYVIESGFSNTGAIADHRLPLRANEIEAFTSILGVQLGAEGLVSSEGYTLAMPQAWTELLVNDLDAHRGSSLIMVGAKQPPAVHAMAHLINQALGNVGNTVFYTDPVPANPVNQTESLISLARDLQAGQVELLVILDGNPAYTTPADVNFGGLIGQAGLSVYLGRYNDETARLTDWHLPAAHYLEMWSDARAFDGTVSIVQPLIEPLYGGFSPHELLAELLGRPQTSGYDLLREFWLNLWNVENHIENNQGQNGFEQAWQQWLQDGIIEGTAFEERQVTLRSDWLSRLPPSLSPVAFQQPEQEPGLEIVFEPDPSLWDGRFANNSWLQELPRPLTKLTWDNAAIIGPAVAERLNLVNFNVVELHYEGRSIRAPIWIMPGQPDGVVTVHLGYGRRHGGQVLPNTGFNGYILRSAANPWFGQGLEIRSTGLIYQLASTQTHQFMEERDLVLTGTVAQFQEDPHFLESGSDPEHDLPSLLPEWPYDGHAWGMSINLSACTGCNACVIACQAENNIPVVGKDQVLNSREMHWLRIDTYYEGNLDNPQVHFQPLPCMHCEKAPCEPVCPVAATVHSSEGLNEMVYNRCIGTRYCSNNCPYKVRRFNFLEYSDDAIPLRMLHNPDVTVRGRGVMEKCTYCVQRINKARITAKKEGHPIRENEVVTACQQACPTNAIVFGDINNPESQVRRLKDQPHNYSLLGDLGTQPRTTYLAKLTNPNPRFETGGQDA
jgi:MoCo/4Fe-4S cofactor protein with predicted Tat translocation signal